MKPKLDVNDKIVGRPIRLNRKTLEVKSGKDYAELIFMGDAHYGSHEFNQKKFLAMLDYCLHKRIYILLMGDLLECCTRESIGAGVYYQEGTAQDQYEQMLDWLRPAAKAGLIVGIHIGNHEERLVNMVGVNIIKAMCRELAVPYLGDACWTSVKVGSQSYTIRSLHGRTASRYEGTVLLAAERCSVSFNADIFAMGHAHKCVNGYIIRERVVGGRVVQEKEFIVVTGSYLEYHDSYYEKTGGQISKVGSPKVKLSSTKHDVFISW
jgi:hypothetical protein